MANIAIVETKPSRTNYKKYFPFEFDRYYLCSDSSLKTVRKKDIDIEFDPDAYEWVILVGKDALKQYTGKTAVVDYSGKLIDGKFLAVINPGMLAFKPEMEGLWNTSKNSIIAYISGDFSGAIQDTSRFPGIQDEQEAYDFLMEAITHKNKYCAVDCETTGLYPLDGYLQGISISYKKDWGAYISSDVFSERVVDLFQELIRKKIIIFHNAKFDIPFIEHHLGVLFYDFEDTMLIHYCLDENPGTHGLKQLALKHTEYGDYEAELSNWMNDYCKKHGLLKGQFSWEFIPFEVMTPYAATDSVVTLLLFSHLYPILAKNSKLVKVYRDILLPACRMLMTMQKNGVPFDHKRLEYGQAVMSQSIARSMEVLNEYPEIQEFIKETGDFNPNSPTQLRALLFDKIGLTPTGKKTDTNQHSTDAEVLTTLSEYHPIPAQIINVRKKSKIKNTYLDKIIVNLNKDNRLRTNFNLHGTVAGRLSSSGKMNMQQLPRDASVVKGSIKARPGYKIVSMDLKTAEVYVAAVLSQDKGLLEIFKQNKDFHSSIAKSVFSLTCEVEDVKKLYPALRQAAKSVTFGILYQAGAYTVAETINKDARTFKLDIYFTQKDAQDAIDAYFKQFPTLKKWIDKGKARIQSDGFTYSFFGRKRRLPNVKSDNKAVVSHAIRSGLNFEVQSPSSDVNLIGATEMQQYLDVTPEMEAYMFALVHDSVVAEVREDCIPEYQEKLMYYIQKDRGLSIPGAPIGCDFEVHDDYSFGKFDKEHAELFQLWCDTPVEHREALELNNNIQSG